MSASQPVLIITGASSGIGKATRLLMHQKGCRVYNLDLMDPADGIGNFIPCDMRDREAIRKAVQQLATNPSEFNYEKYGYYDYSHFCKHLKQFLQKDTLSSLQPHLTLLQKVNRKK